MPEKRIISIGNAFPCSEISDVGFRSNNSLLDADIIVVLPRFEELQGLEYDEEYKEMRARIEHWQNALNDALAQGKTVFCFLVGETEDSIDSYSIFPDDVRPSIRSKTGDEIRPVSDLRFLVDYWREQGSNSLFEAYIDGDLGEVLLKTKYGNKSLGGVQRVRPGSVVFLPALRKWRQLVHYGTQDPELVSLAKSLAGHFVRMDKVLRGETMATPPPTWTMDEKYKLERERVLHGQVSSLSSQIEGFKTKQSTLISEVEALGDLRRLLYEKSAGLEEAIMEALGILGFEAKRHKEADSEFDVVFASPEGRFLGEVEGKDNRAVDIHKLDQLERNIQEDIELDGITEYAKGVLFANAFRLEPPGTRQEFFTQKCLSGAKRYRVALVRTTDLFEAAKRVLDQGDEIYAQRCREAIKGAEGTIVSFPTTTF